ncbi:MAG: D-hexose-6-phosphate mutarotase [Mariprofundaceae bacterium]
MAKNFFTFEKRQKELAKQKKKADKQLRKTEKRNTSPTGYLNSDGITALNKRLGLPDGHLSIYENPEGLAVIAVSNDSGKAEIALQGAHLMTWTPKGQDAVIWLSEDATFAPGKSIRGGSPVCWPWFGPHESENSFPGHGFARTVAWELLEVEAISSAETQLVFGLIQNENTREQWPHATELESHITIGPALSVDLVTHNHGGTPVTIGNALHTYFAVADIRKVSIEGLDGCPYIDKMDDGARKQQDGPVVITEETDRIYLDSTADCIINDPGNNRRIRISKRGSASTIVWNPWIETAAKMGDLGEDGYLNMVCVENANAADDVVTIAAGDSHHLWVSYSVE